MLRSWIPAFAGMTGKVRVKGWDMSREIAFIAALRAYATDPAARGLMDDAAVLPRPGGDLVLTHDMMVEGVHYLPGDAPADVAWKLVAVNLSDLAAKGAVPVGVLLGYAMTQDPAWDAAFAQGIGAAAAAMGVPLLGGDTVRMPDGAPRALGLTAVGQAPASGAPSRAGAGAGDRLWVSGIVGDAGLGLAIRQGRAQGDVALVERYLRPQPRLALGQALAPLVTAMADMSDGLLIDARRIAHASGCAITIDLGAVPLSDAFLAAAGGDVAARLKAATSGDDYELLFTAPAASDPKIRAAAKACAVAVTPVGLCAVGQDIALTLEEAAVALPGNLGWLHD
jgi:thiamine-monophosphate kinase